MRIKEFFLIIIILGLSSQGCSASSSGISGIVVDAKTEKPIEGAVILVEWTVTKGFPGLSYGKDYKVVEAMTSKDGRFSLSGVLNPLVNPPRLTVYKKGYVAWNNEYIFPTWEKRNDFIWAAGVIIKVEPFKKEYSRSDHVYFLHNVTHWGKLINEAYRWEEIEKEN